MNKFDVSFAHDYFPDTKDKLPFGEIMNDLFLNSDIPDFPIHAVNVVRFVELLLNDNISNLLKEPNHDLHTEAVLKYNKYSGQIQECMEMDSGDAVRKTRSFMKIAALYHDIGKYIRKENHPQIGVNILRNLNDDECNKLVNALTWSKDDNEDSKHHRFSLICSLIQHHDKFGVITTGEGSLPLLSDILYFTSDEHSISGIKKNATSVMMLNLADISGVCRAPAADISAAKQYATKIFEQRGKGQDCEEGLEKIKEICVKQSSYLGLRFAKVNNILNDWDILIKAIDHVSVKGNRSRLKDYLIKFEENPDRTIKRILRIINECFDACDAVELSKHINATTVETVLVGALGSHQFQSFCEKFAIIVKLDYGLNFFKAITCACIRKFLDREYRLENENSWSRLNSSESDAVGKLEKKATQDLNNKITSLMVKVLHGIILRYSSLLDSKSLNPYRFGLQMRDLTTDHNIRESILNFLCIDENKEHVALTWIADEVTFWSMD